MLLCPIIVSSNPPLALARHHCRPHMHDFHLRQQGRPGSRVEVRFGYDSRRIDARSAIKNTQQTWGLRTLSTEVLLHMHPNHLLRRHIILHSNTINRVSPSTPIPLETIGTLIQSATILSPPPMLRPAPPPAGGTAGWNGPREDPSYTHPARRDCLAAIDQGPLDSCISAHTHSLSSPCRPDGWPSSLTALHLPSSALAPPSLSTTFLEPRSRHGLHPPAPFATLLPSSRVPFNVHFGLYLELQLGAVDQLACSTVSPPPIHH
ncbi:hypothetical protein FIBSPDRAFT_102279 [Athelia psychrophila]|uniref:Uncharacterized protein n=1 Tax=Athelia psychrophila TaxID=1759441 RepID=A0A166DHX4_9AGAM|nr:hypothetical protein FIBSPDRAFT_102279 [Fibularhizoctonia sp. CBS 109695]